MTLKLRPHHLLCILTYAGKGYSANFVENFNAVIKRIEDGQTINIVYGPDDICSPIQSKPESHCNKARVLERDLMAAQDLAEILSTPLAPGSSLRLLTTQIQRLRKDFAKNHIRSACRGCEWHELCTAIAGRQFAACHLQGKNPLIRE